ncbi:hypothetical protein J437_LFUL004482 [Ladona fulva]|uniref:Uncharacterized protein n=1 Tax=Ladona fulva TaxID=123851 RepID=A0A8K0JZD6_LADFU|nr:hypothetical protein J437_LFUL004482 [Ladona fulva]
MPISGVLCDLDLPVYWWLLGPGGWPLAFYIFGALGIVWYIAWMALVSDSPATHKSICLKERYFIEWSLRQENGLSEHQRHGDDNTANTPWLHIATSLPLWAALLTLWGQSWAFYTLLTELPTYMANMLHYDIKKNSFLSGLPYLFQWLCSLVFCWIADWLCSSGYLSNTASMKLFNSIVCKVISSQKFGNRTRNITVKEAYHISWVINYLALSPRLAGTLYGITNCISNFSGFLAPYATGSIIEGHETLTRWKYVFLLSAGINIFGNVFYLFFGSGKVQPWDDPEYDSDRRHLLPTSSETYESHSVPCDQENQGKD